jgi:hypothetical protein
MKKKTELIFSPDVAKRVIQENIGLFTYRPIFSAADSDVLRFRDVTRHISWTVGRSGSISVHANYRNGWHDIVQEFDLIPECNRTKRFRCGLCRTNPDEAVPSPLPDYESIEQLWLEHCLKPLAEWVRESFTDDALLCFCGSRSGTAGFICGSESQKERIMSRSDFFKAVRVTLKSGRTNKANSQPQ